MEPEIDGATPQWLGSICEQIFFSQHWHKGELSEGVNTAHFLVEGVWTCLFFDSGIVFWRNNRGMPEEFSAPELDSEFKLLDIGEQKGLRGKTIIALEQLSTATGARVSLGFEGGKTLSIENRMDLTEYAC